MLICRYGLPWLLSCEIAHLVAVFLAMLLPTSSAHVNKFATPNVFLLLGPVPLSESRVGCVAHRRVCWTLVLQLETWQRHLHPLPAPPLSLCKATSLLHHPPSFPSLVAAVLPLLRICFPDPILTRSRCSQIGQKGCLLCCLPLKYHPCGSLAQPDLTQSWPNQGSSKLDFSPITPASS